MWHLYEVLIASSRLWLKIQASCSSSEQAAAFFECRFNGTDYGDHRPITPFTLSRRSHYIANWAAIVDRLPEQWDDDEFHIVGTPYPWCETLSDKCDCRGANGRLDAAYCSDFGSHADTDKRTSKSQNVRHLDNTRRMEESLARRDESQRKRMLQRARPSPPPTATPVPPQPAPPSPHRKARTAFLSNVMAIVNPLVARGFYCSVDGRHHPYGTQAIRKAALNLAAVWAQLSTRNAADRRLGTSAMGALAAHMLKAHQSEECAQRSLSGDVDIPNVLYKYIPAKRIGDGAPDSLRATQLLSLNDDMECNVTAMKGSQQEDTLAFLALVQSRLEEHLGISVPWDELLTRSLRYADVRLSTFVQEYLNPLVGVVSFSTDILVPTMWAHYARNTGIVVGYDRDALTPLGFELRPVIYSELAPIYQPSAGDTIRLDFVNREDMERDLRAGRTTEGFPILASTELAAFGGDWKALSRLLLVKGLSWAYEKEVRLLVDLEHARDTGRCDDNDSPVKVIEPPPEAIKEIYAGANTRTADLEHAVQVARGDEKRGLFVGRLSSHAFRIQKTGGTRY